MVSVRPCFIVLEKADAKLRKVERKAKEKLHSFFFPFVTFLPFNPLFLAIHHKTQQIIPDIWRQHIFAVPLQRD
jgi:hypothetical protein